MALADNLVSYWKFDESSGNAADSVTTNNLTNFGTTPYAAALINNGADFGTANSTKYFEIASAMGFAGGNCSMNFWFKVQTEIASGTWSLYYLSMETSQTRYRIEYNYGGGTRNITWYRSTPGNGGSDKSVAYNVTLGTAGWHMLTYTYDGTTLRGYVDGVQQATVAASGSGSLTVGNSFTVGAYSGGASGHPSSYVDEGGIWSRALTSTEITSLYNGGAGFQYPFVSVVNTLAFGHFA